MITGFVIRTDGSTEVIAVTSEDLVYESIVQIVGGWIELVPPGDEAWRHVSVYCNEEGKIHGLPFNEKATDLTKRVLFDPIVGDVVVFGGPDGDGNDTSLSEQDISLLQGRYS